jgi:hypothetical protein
MVVRFFIDPVTGLPHVENHNVAPSEVLEVLRGSSDQRPGREGSRIADGQTLQGRYLRVIFKENEWDGSLFIITAYDLSNREKTAFRRRRKRRGS